MSLPGEGFEFTGGEVDVVTLDADLLPPTDFNFGMPPENSPPALDMPPPPPPGGLNAPPPPPPDGLGSVQRRNNEMH